MDRRKMNPTTEEKNGAVLISFNPDIEPELKEWSDKSLKNNSEYMRYVPLKLWANFKAENDEKYKQYPQYENDPHLALKEAVEIANELRDTHDSSYNLFNHSVPAEVCSVLLRNYLDQLS